MRHLVFLPLALSPLLAFACGNDTSSGASGSEDGGPTLAPPTPTPTPPPDSPRDSGSTEEAGKDAGAGKAAAGIYVADTFNDRLVYIADMTGTGWTALGTLAASGNDAGVPGAFSSPRDVFVSSASYIYVADCGNDRIVRMDDMTGAGWTTFGKTGTGTNQMGCPFGITVDAQERIYITDLGNSRVIRVDDMTGAGWTTWGIPYTDGGAFQMNAVERVAVTPDGSKIYVTDSSGPWIARWDSNGTNWQTFGQSGTGSMQYSDPFGIAVQSSGDLLVGDVGNIRITSVAFGSNTGTQFNFAGGGTVDGVATAGGKIYFTNMVKGEIVRVDDLNGTNQVIFGTGGTGTNQFKKPQGISVK